MPFLSPLKDLNYENAFFFHFKFYKLGHIISICLEPEIAHSFSKRFTLVNSIMFTRANCLSCVELVSFLFKCISELYIFNFRLFLKIFSTRQRRPVRSRIGRRIATRTCSLVNKNTFLSHS